MLYVATESGALAAVGNAFLHGAVAAAHIIKASGGILGHRITLKIVDPAHDDDSQQGQIDRLNPSTEERERPVASDEGHRLGIRPSSAIHTNQTVSSIRPDFQHEHARFGAQTSVVSLHSIRTVCR